jgi:hypothetical protein
VWWWPSNNVWTLALRLGVPIWVEPLVAPAVDLSILGLLLGTRHLALHGATPELEPPARWLALFVGPFATVTDARAWTAEAASDTGWGTDRPRLRVHPLRRTDTVPVAAPTPGPDTEPVGVA